MAQQTKGAKDVRLILQDDRNLVLYGFDGPAWSSDTHTDEAPPPPVEKRRGRELPRSRRPHLPRPRSPLHLRLRRRLRHPAAPRTYTVVSGDTLWAISERFYGDGNKYQQIAEASGIANPDLIHPGQVLTIP